MSLVQLCQIQASLQKQASPSTSASPLTSETSEDREEEEGSLLSYPAFAPRAVLASGKREGDRQRGE
jgi:hypothetical protein